MSDIPKYNTVQLYNPYASLWVLLYIEQWLNGSPFLSMQKYLLVWQDRETEQWHALE